MGKTKMVKTVQIIALVVLIASSLSFSWSEKHKREIESAGLTVGQVDKALACDRALHEMSMTEHYTPKVLIIIEFQVADSLSNHLWIKKREDHHVSQFVDMLAETHKPLAQAIEKVLKECKGVTYLQHFLTSEFLHSLPQHEKRGILGETE